MRLEEIRKSVESERVRLDRSSHELKELTGPVEMVIDILTEEPLPDQGTIEKVVSSLFIIRREMQRISDDIDEVVSREE